MRPKNIFSFLLHFTLKLLHKCAERRWCNKLFEYCEPMQWFLVEFLHREGDGVMCDSWGEGLRLIQTSLSLNTHKMPAAWHQTIWWMPLLTCWTAFCWRYVNKASSGRSMTEALCLNWCMTTRMQDLKHVVPLYCLTDLLDVPVY